MFSWMPHIYVRIQNNKDFKLIKFYLNILSHQPRITCHFCWSVKKTLPGIPQEKCLNTSRVRDPKIPEASTVQIDDEAKILGKRIR